MRTDGAIITNAGLELISYAIANNKNITFTKTKLGKGDVNSFDEAKKLTDVVSFYKQIPITSIYRNNSGVIRIRSTFTNEDFPIEVVLKEVGIFATVEGKSETLFAYVNDGAGESFPPGTSGNVVERVRDIYVGVSTAIEVNAIIDKSTIYATIFDLEEGLNKKEDKFIKNSGFNKNKSDSTSLDDSNTLATSKAVKLTMQKAAEASNEAAEKEPKFEKNSGFNKNKSDSTSLDDSNTLATSKAVKLTMEKATEASNTAAGKEPKFEKNSGFNKNFGVAQNEVLEGSKLAEILGIEYGGVLNNSNQKIAGKGYYDTANKKIYKCTVNTSINYADAGYFIEVSNNDLLGKLQNLAQKHIIGSYLIPTDLVKSKKYSFNLFEDISNFHFVGYYLVDSGSGLEDSYCYGIFPTDIMHSITMCSNPIDDLIWHTPQEKIYSFRRVRAYSRICEFLIFDIRNPDSIMDNNNRIQVVGLCRK